MENCYHNLVKPYLSTIIPFGCGGDALPFHLSTHTNKPCKILEHFFGYPDIKFIQEYGKKLNYSKKLRTQWKEKQISDYRHIVYDITTPTDNRVCVDGELKQPVSETMELCQSFCANCINNNRGFYK
ncbi:MAG: hypothetical protein LBL75_02670 [Rickettsiales bacterium]|nr:hypothetical protein [Rickettsiales bacterium]